MADKTKDKRQKYKDKSNLKKTLDTRLRAQGSGIAHRSLLTFIEN
jgi:hypothetical protein